MAVWNIKNIAWKRTSANKGGREVGVKTRKFWANVLFECPLKFQLKWCRGDMSHDTEEWCKIWRFFVLKMTRIWWILIRTLKCLKICSLIGPFCTKYITFDLKKYRGNMFHDTEESCKIWRKIDLLFGKWHGGFGKFSSEHLKASKFVLSWDLFCPKYK